MPQRTPAHVRRLSPRDDKFCFSFLTDLEYIRGVITEMSRSGYVQVGEGTLVMEPPGGIDSGLILELWENVGRQNQSCNLLKARGIAIGQRYYDFLATLSTKYGQQSKAPITYSELDELDRLQISYIDAALEDMLQMDTGEGDEQPPPPPPPPPPRPSLLPPGLRAP